MDNYPPDPSSRGSTLEPIHGRRQVKHYLVSEHELASISAMSGGAAFGFTVGLFLWGLAATIYFGAPTPTPTGPAIVACALLGLVLISVAVLLLLARREDISRIKNETKFD